MNSNRSTPTRAVIAVVLALVTIVVAACGADDDDARQASAADVTRGTDSTASTLTDAGPDDTATLLPPAEGKMQYPLTLTSWAGETVLEERPERIAAIGFSPNVDALEAIGVTPVYTLALEYPWNDPQWAEGIEFVDTATRKDPINFEGIAAAQPDLIIALNFVMDEQEYDKLAQIAPVLEHAEKIGTDQIDWRADQQLIGDVLDLRAAADEAIAAADEAIAAAAAAHPEFAGKTATIAYDYGPEYSLEYYTPTGGTAEGLLLELGFSPNPLAEKFVESPEVANENVDKLDGDALLMFYSTDAIQEARESQPLFQALPPVAAGRYTAVSFEELFDGWHSVWALRRGASARSLPWAIEHIAEWLGGAVAA